MNLRDELTKSQEQVLEAECAAHELRLVLTSMEMRFKKLAEALKEAADEIPTEDDPG